MVERASLEIVVLRVLDTGVDLELVKVKEHYTLTLGDISGIRSLDMSFAMILRYKVLSWAEIGLWVVYLFKVMIEGLIHLRLVHLVWMTLHLLLHGSKLGLLL